MFSYRSILGEFAEPMEDDLIETAIEMGDLDNDDSINYEEVLKVIKENEDYIDKAGVLLFEEPTNDQLDQAQTPEKRISSEEACLLSQQPSASAQKSNGKNKKNKKKKNDLKEN